MTTRLVLTMTGLFGLCSAALAADSNTNGCEDSYEVGGTCVSTSATLDPSVTVGAGSQVGEFAAIGPDVDLGASVTVGARAEIVGAVGVTGPFAIGDNTVIGRNAVLGAGAATGNDVTIGRNVEVGTGLDIGQGSFIGFDSDVGVEVTIGTSVAIGSIAEVGDYASIGNGAVLARGVKVLDAASASGGSSIDGIVGPFTEIGAGSSVAATSRLRKDVTLGTNVTIEAGVRIARDVVIGDGATISANAIIGAGAEIIAGQTVDPGVRVGRGETVGPLNGPETVYTQLGLSSFGVDTGATTHTFGTIPGMAGQAIEIMQVGMCGDSDAQSGDNRFRAAGAGLDISWVAGQQTTAATYRLPPTIINSPGHGMTSQTVSHQADVGADVTVSWDYHVDYDGQYCYLADDGFGNSFNDSANVSSIRVWIVYRYVTL